MMHFCYAGRSEGGGRDRCFSEDFNPGNLTYMSKPQANERFCLKQNGGRFLRNSIRNILKPSHVWRSHLHTHTHTHSHIHAHTRPGSWQGCPQTHFTCWSTHCPLQAADPYPRHRPSFLPIGLLALLCPFLLGHCPVLLPPGSADAWAEPPFLAPPPSLTRIHRCRNEWWLALGSWPALFPQSSAGTLVALKGVSKA